MVDCKTPTMRPFSTPNATLSTDMSLMLIKVIGSLSPNNSYGFSTFELKIGRPKISALGPMLLGCLRTRFRDLR